MDRFHKPDMLRCMPRNAEVWLMLKLVERKDVRGGVDESWNFDAVLSVSANVH